MFINGRFLTQRVTGVQRFAHEIVQALAQNGLPDSTTLIVPPKAEVPKSLAGSIPTRTVGRHQGHLWEQLDLPRLPPDELLLNLCNTAPMGRRRQLVVLHDAAVAALPKNFTFAFRCWYQLMIRAYGRRAQMLATVSEFSAGEISRHFGIKRERIAVIPESGEHILRHTPNYSVHARYGLDQDGYFLAVSSLAANKNFEGVLRAVAMLPRLPFKFVIVGGRNARIFNAANGELDGAVEVGYVSDAELRALYERAACFVFPSTYEGFGLPPLEAMMCGCPVLMSNAASLPEVGGDAVSYCDPHDSGDIARKLLLLLENKALRQERREAGLARAKEWTWDKAARRLMEVTGK